MQHRGKQKLKVEFDVHIERVTGLSGAVGESVFIAWRRGTKAKSGLTRRALVGGDGTATFGEHVVFAGTVFRNAATGDVDDKALTLALRMVVPGKSAGRLLYKTSVNLAPHAHASLEPGARAPTVAVPLDRTARRGAAPAPALHASFASRPTKLNHRRLVPADPAAAAAAAAPGGMRMLREIDGRTYYVDEDGGGSAVSGTTVDSASVATGLEEREPLPEPSDDAAAAASAAAAPAANPSALAASGGNGGGGSVSQQQHQLLVGSLRREIEMLQLENYEKTKLLAEMQKQLNELRASSAAAAASAPAVAIAASPAVSASSGLQTPASPVVPSRSTSGLLGMPGSHGGGHRLRISESISAAQALAEDSANTKALEQAREEFVFLEKTIYQASMHPEPAQPQTAPTPTASTPATPTARAIFAKLVAWKAFKGQQGKPELVSRVVAAIDSAANTSQGNLPRMSYWLSTMCGLVRLARDPAVSAAEGDNVSKEALAAFDGRVTFVLFRVYSAIATHIIDQIKDYLVPVILRSNTFESDIRGSHALLPGVLGHVSDLILRPLTLALLSLREVKAPWGLIVQLFSQVCYTITARVFNHVLTHKEDCAVERGFQIKMELSRLRDWLVANNMKEALQQLRPLGDVATVFIADKSLFADPGAITAVCPSITPTQLRRLLSSFPDTPAAVLAKLKAQGQSGDTGEMDEQFMQRLSYEFLENAEITPSTLLSPRKTQQP